jgi:hypothetical protein
MTRNTLVVNLLGGPGAGKSTAAWEIAATLKKSGKSVELIAEYAKELVYDKRFDLLDGSAKNQRLVCEEQVRRQERLMGEVDYAITDSPIMLQLLYLKDRESDAGKALTREIEEYLLDYKLSVFNVVVKRHGLFEENGRIHTEVQSMDIDDSVVDLLRHYSKSYMEYYQSNGLEQVIEGIESKYKSLQNTADYDLVHKSRKSR